jgi:hypothetical protein
VAFWLNLLARLRARRRRENAVCIVGERAADVDLQFAYGDPPVACSIAVAKSVNNASKVVKR